jgi:hypothetical protein
LGLGVGFRIGIQGLGYRVSELASEVTDFRIRVRDSGVYDDVRCLRPQHWFHRLALFWKNLEAHYFHYFLTGL